MKRHLAIMVLILLATSSIALASRGEQQGEPCDPKDQDCLARIVQQYVEQAPEQQKMMQQEAIESGHLYILEVAGKEVQVLLRDPQDRREPFIVRLPSEWQPILEGTEQANAGDIIAAVRQGFDQLVAKIRKMNETGQQIGQDTRHYQALGGKITQQYLEELLARLSGSGASQEVKDAGQRLKQAADARLADEPSFYADRGGDEAEAEDVKALYGFLQSIRMVEFY